MVTLLCREYRLTLSVLAVFFGISGTPYMSQAQESGDALGLLEEVVVTAQRREQSILDIPSALTVVSGEQIEDQLLTTSHAL